MISALQKDDALLADIRAPQAPDEFRLWWLGQSGFLVQWQHRHLLLDPYLSDSLTHKYAATDKPHTRMTERVIAPEQLDFVQVVTSSHNHTDHLDAQTLQPLRQANPGLKILAPEANRAFVAERASVAASEIIGLDDGASVEVDDWHFTGIAAAHNELERDERGHCKYLGFVVRFGPWTIYHSGDTLLHDKLAESLRAHRMDVALLPINGNKPERRVAGNLDGQEAAQLAHDIGARLVIPCHYEMFEFNTASPDEFVAEAKRLNQGYRVLRAGEAWSSQELA